MICRFTSARNFPQRGCKLNEPNGFEPLRRVHDRIIRVFLANKFCSQAVTSPFVRDYQLFLVTEVLRRSALSVDMDSSAAFHPHKIRLAAPIKVF